jgi:hypothetical protein
MPKLPPPPRRPQRRSWFSSALAVVTSPVAVTTSAESRLSQVSPYFPLSQPSPPPSARPDSPVTDTTPVGVASPNACVWRSRSASVMPVCTVATRRAGSTLPPFIGDRSSMTPPLQTALPATL